LTVDFCDFFKKTKHRIIYIRLYIGVSSRTLPVRFVTTRTAGHSYKDINCKKALLVLLNSASASTSIKQLLNKGERYSQVPRLSDTRYSAKETKGKWRYASSKARLKYATYPRSQYMDMWAVDRSRRYGRYSGRGTLSLGSIDRY